ncbi:MAG: hypothetical protein OEY01_12180 [Desulfobulbaceae bacterium]|nr:hypothetical protein [Desulfobulbaceae bacterium]
MSFPEYEEERIKISQSLHSKLPPNIIPTWVDNSTLILADKETNKTIKKFYYGNLGPKEPEDVKAFISAVARYIEEGGKDNQ